MWLKAKATLISLLAFLCCVGVKSSLHVSPTTPNDPSSNRTISPELFDELEELARIVDISYCVGNSGIYEPFTCVSRCEEFPSFELVKTWNTGPLLADSCGYIALSHPPSPPRIIVAFRGTYSISNAIVDLSTIPQEFEPYPPPSSRLPLKDDPDASSSCSNCTAHVGFLTSWARTRTEILPYLEELVKFYPSYDLTLAGHSLGGAVALFAALDFHNRGWKPQVTTFGEPRVGNAALIQYIDAMFAETSEELWTYRRVTHVRDPVPLLPLSEWSYRMHGNELFINKAALPPSRTDIVYCDGDADDSCIAGGDQLVTEKLRGTTEGEARSKWWSEDGGMWAIPARYQLWELLFAHRDYFHRLGLCVPGGDPGGQWRWNDASKEL
ncbi:MAG: hypothetical protein M1833_003225 [Piccolia ochrophora]|nr:MAG: hypothetical protein M1833_003225 [Piccolia ochrophora]